MSGTRHCRAGRALTPWISTVALLLLCNIAPALSGCGRTRRPPNILLISLDACRADHLGAYGYPRETSPFIDSVAARGTLFTNAFVNTHGTPSSHTTILSSLYQETHRVGYDDRKGLARNRIPNEVALLQEHLQRNGYVTVGVTAGGWMSGEFGYERGFTAFDDQPKKGIGSARLVKLVRQYMGEGRPIFAFLHTYYIHSPYDPPAPYRRLWGSFPSRFEASSENLLAINAGKLAVTGQDVRFIEAMYDGGIRFTDDALRRMFAELERLGFFGNHLVVITADHGEELGERGAFLHRDLLYDDLIHVPLIFEGNAVSSGMVDRGLASSVDIAPTILRQAGVEPDVRLEGRDLLSSPAPESVFSQYAGRRYAIRTADWKLIANLEPRSLELYDLRNDPQERNDLAGGLSEKVKALEERLWAWREGLPTLGTAGPHEVEIDEREVERLRALGYLP